MAIDSETVSNDKETKGKLFKTLLEYAVRAPSGHNTQPWLFNFSDEMSLYLLADRTRRLPVVDPFDRELTISCGAILDHLEVASLAKGIELDISTCPDPRKKDVLAHVQIRGLCTQSHQDLFAAIHTRRTTRTRFEETQLPEALVRQCESIAKEFGVELTLISDRQHRMQLADLVAEGDSIQFADSAFRQELASWVHSRRRVSNDGMSGSGFGMPDILSPAGALAIRTFDLGSGIAASDKQKIVNGSPLLAVFSSNVDSIEYWLQTGRALSRVLLTLAANGATASYLNPPIEVEQLRPRLRDAIACKGMPQLLLRFGYGPSAEPTVRRDVEQLLQRN